MSNPKIIIAEKILIPQNKASLSNVKENYEFFLYKEQMCKACENKQDRPNSICYRCDAFQGKIKLWSDIKIGKKSYYGVPAGNITKVASIFNFTKKDLIDKRNKVQMSVDLKFTGHLFNGVEENEGQPTVNQILVVKTWMENKRGIIELPPRSGKSVVAVAITCQLQVKTIIVTHQHELSLGFYKSFLRDTNLKKLRKENPNRKIVNVVTKLEEMKNLDVAIISYQKFIKDKTSASRIKECINDNGFSFLIVDEAHHGFAESYSNFLNSLNVRYRCPLSATPDRKDGRSRMLQDLFHPDRVKVESISLKPKITFWLTGVGENKSYVQWVYAMKYLASQEERNRMIVRQVFKDLREGRTIILPVDFIDHMNKLVQMINNQAEINNKKRNENWPEQLATGFSSRSSDRKKILENFETGVHRVLVGIRSIIREGITFERADTIYILVPMSAGDISVGSPIFYQLVYRVCTARRDKNPIVRILVDDIGQSAGCVKALSSREIMPGLKGSNARYRIDKENFDIMLNILNSRSKFAYSKKEDYRQKMMEQKMKNSYLNINSSVGASDPEAVR